MRSRKRIIFLLKQNIFMPPERGVIQTKPTAGRTQKYAPQKPMHRHRASRSRRVSRCLSRGQDRINRSVRRLHPHDRQHFRA